MGSLSPSTPPRGRTPSTDSLPRMPRDTSGQAVLLTTAARGSAGTTSMSPPSNSLIPSIGPTLEELTLPVPSQTTEQLRKGPLRPAWPSSTTSMLMESNGTMWPVTTGSRQCASPGSSRLLQEIPSGLPSATKESFPSSSFHSHLTPLFSRRHHRFCSKPHKPVFFSLFMKIFIIKYSILKDKKYMSLH